MSLVGNSMLYHFSKYSDILVVSTESMTETFILKLRPLLMDG